MGFMDKAKEAAEDLKASFASTEVRDSEQSYRDLGMLAYLTTTGRPIDEADRQRLINTLWSIEQQGKLPAFRLVTSPPPPPPPPPPAPAPMGQAAPPPPPRPARACARRVRRRAASATTRTSGGAAAAGRARAPGTARGSPGPAPPPPEEQKPPAP